MIKSHNKLQANNAILVTPNIANPIVPAARVTVHGAGETQWWFDARDTDDCQLLGAVEKSNCTHVVVHFNMHKQIRTSKQKVVWVDGSDQLAELEDDAWVYTNAEEIHAIATAAGRKTGMFIDVVSLEKEFSRCVEVCERGDDFVIIDIEHATYIPYELLLAKTEGKTTKILRSVPIKGLVNIVDSVNQSLNAFATMERGIGVLFKTRDIEAVKSLSRHLTHRQSGCLQLVRAEVEDVQHTGLGHRVCVDTTSLMTAEEGMIVGSTGWGGIFVCSESHYLPHMNLREFRVNAGSVHSYIWGPNNNVMYLSEMKAGMEVLCTDINGNSRVVAVGRAKIERRPLLKIRCSVSLDQVTPEIRKAVEVAYTIQRKVTPEGEKLSSENLQRVYINTFLQNDWHVRLMGADGKIRHSTLVQPGDELLAHIEIPGRHTGLKVTEHILER